ncbi:hypothetical protein Ptr902_08852 [Pyrenophora tritici-repentis]|nr:hypothetical protein Ptr902_08852 [Pyrenophora tritici-repentis]
MCTETYTHYIRCTHKQLQRWDYCAVLMPADRIPRTGRACRRYKLRHKDTFNNDACYECLRERAIAEATGAVLPPSPQRAGVQARGLFAMSDTFSTLAGSTSMGSVFVRDKRGSKDSAGSLAQSDGPGSPVKMAWERDEEEYGHEEKKKKGIKGWFKQVLQGTEMDRAEAASMAFQFPRMDA